MATMLAMKGAREVYNHHGQITSGVTTAYANMDKDELRKVIQQKNLRDAATLGVKTCSDLNKGYRAVPTSKKQDAKDSSKHNKGKEAKGKGGIRCIVM